MRKQPSRKPRQPRRRPGDSPRRVDHRSGSIASAGLAELRGQLERELAATEDRIRGIEVVPGPDERAPAGADSVFDETDHIHTSQAQEIRLATRKRLVKRIEGIRAALERMSRGEYGRCVECGEPVGRARLAAMPEVERCVRCQERAERRRGREGGRAA